MFEIRELFQYEGSLYAFIGFVFISNRLNGG